MSEENVELVRRLFSLWEQRDYAAVGQFLDPDIVFARIGSEFADLAGEWKGLTDSWAAMVDYLRMWDDLQTRPERFVDLEDDRVLVFMKQVGRGRGSGVLVEHEGAFVFTTRDRTVARWDAYWHRAEAIRAAGLADDLGAHVE